MRFAVLFLIGLVAFAGCEREDDPALVRAEKETLRALIASDETAEALVEVDRLVDQERPYLAAEVLQGGALAKALQQSERARALPASQTKTVGPLHRRIAAAYKKRADAIAAYAVSLSRGGRDSADLLQILGNQREAELEISAVAKELE